MPAFRHARISEADVTQLPPATFTSDLIVLLEHGLERKTACAIIVEAQLRTDADKRRPPGPSTSAASTPSSTATPFSSSSPSTRPSPSGAAKPISIGHPGFDLTPLVLGPDEVPVITEPEKAVPHPELPDATVAELASVLMKRSRTSTSRSAVQRAPFRLEFSRKKVVHRSSPSSATRPSTANAEKSSVRSSRKRT